MIKWYVIPNFYSIEEIIEINKLISKNINDEYNDRPSLGKKADVKIAMFNDELKEALARTINLTNQLNEEYFGYNLYNRVPYTINVNTYEKNSQYEFHIDHSLPEMANDIKLTVILNTSTEPFTGGEFDFFVNGVSAYIREMDKPGTLLIFPSLIPHRVSPIKTGTRKTLSIWFDGPKWK